MKRPSPADAARWAQCWFQPEGNELFCMRQDGQLSVPKKLQKAWHPATLALLPERALENKR